MRSAFKFIQKHILACSPVKRFIFPRYQYSFSPVQLGLINKYFVESHDIYGISLEIGCFVGATTVFLNTNYRYGLNSRPYLCYDTFSGFTASDIAHEEAKRGKDLSHVHDETLFKVNSLHWFKYTMAINGLTNVVTHQMDVNHLRAADLTSDISFALIDVDLYLPTMASLEAVFPRLAPGGVILVDDCIENSIFDGSLQALHSFCGNHGLSYRIEAGKIGVLRK